ncbi:MAG: hypothetical protein F6K42_06895, partial [Leptolyngbya sp. SIO1D8]|nr:hypothetical protein [Leptolyngbya sp. SIO1D8]
PEPGNAGELSIQPAVLVDFVANPEDGDIDEAQCRDTTGDLIRVPADPATSRSFFACIRESAIGNEDNQNLELFLRGNFEPREGASVGLRAASLNQNSLLPTLRTGVFVQGVIGYDPD